MSNQDERPEATELQRAYDEQRQKVARCAVEWTRAYISLIQMGRDIRQDAYETMRKVNPRLHLKVDDRELDAAELVARVLYQRALGISGDALRMLEHSDPQGALVYCRLMGHRIGECDGFRTPDPANGDKRDQEPYRSLGDDPLFDGQPTPWDHRGNPRRP